MTRTRLALWLAVATTTWLAAGIAWAQERPREARPADTTTESRS